VYGIKSKRKGRTQSWGQVGNPELTGDTGDSCVAIGIPLRSQVIPTAEEDAL